MDFLASLVGQATDPEIVTKVIYFVIAARIYRGWMKKDVAEMKKGITDLKESIDHVAAVLGKRMDTLEGRVDVLEDER